MKVIIDGVEYVPLKKKLIEDHNFKVISIGWKKIIVDNEEYLVNPEGDIWEINEGEFKGEQFFTWDAAMRETKKAGKEIPTMYSGSAGVDRYLYSQAYGFSVRVKI